MEWRVSNLECETVGRSRKNEAAPSLGVRASKRLFDIACASVGLVVASFVLAPAGLAIWLVDGGPVLFGHRRIGRDGVPFTCLKLRTMRQDAEVSLDAVLALSTAARDEWAATQKLRKDPRVLGRVGRFLRESSIDELPQLWNVLRGEMSLVGPRPIVWEELAHYDTQSVWYLSVRPGMTGLWQVAGRSDTSYATRVRLDVQYAQRVSLVRDLGILVRTPWIVLNRRGAC
jgi:lipopolysaccharide/colanic/teichoic acid biosynthesis glycosyltransferase